MTYKEFVKKLVKPGHLIKEELAPEECHLLHMAFALSIEVGELCDPIKKSLIYRKQLDFENIIEELGDIEFYLEAIRTELAISREECLVANMAKLAKRYPGIEYSDKKAQERQDKV